MQAVLDTTAAMAETLGMEYLPADDTDDDPSLSVDDLTLIADLLSSVAAEYEGVEYEDIVTHDQAAEQRASIEAVAEKVAALLVNESPRR